MYLEGKGRAGGVNGEWGMRDAYGKFGVKCEWKDIPD